MAEAVLTIAATLPDPYQSARQAGLRYVNAARPGFTRRRAGKGWVYLDTEGKPIRDPDELRRFQSLVIPPAWTSVWICPYPNGHLQAVGLDARGRRQYRYHSAYREVRDATKFTRMLRFGAVLPKLREQVDADLALPGLPRNKVLAAVVKLLETTSARVGNEEYARTNDSYGLTTLRDHHVKIEGGQIQFQFRGKSGLEHEICLRDRRLARIVADCKDLPGQALFQYLNEEGVGVEPLTPEASAQLGLPRETAGLLVRQVQPGGPAADAGITAGDVLVEANRQPLRAVTDLESAIRTAGDKPVLLLVNRRGQTVYLPVKPQTGQ